MDTEWGAKIRVIRWSARVLGVVVAGGFLFMAIGSILQSHSWYHPEGGGIKPLAAVGLGLLGICSVAMFLALKWERAALRVGVAALLGAQVGGPFLARFEYPGHITLVSFVNPLLLAFWIPILLYLLCWRLEGRGRSKAVL